MIEKRKVNKTESITFRLDSKLRKQLEDLAIRQSAKRHRIVSLSETITQILSEGVKTK